MRCSCYQPFIANFMTNIVTCSSFIRKIDNETEYGYHLANYLGNINVKPSSGLLIITHQHSIMHQNTVVQLTKLKLKTKWAKSSISWWSSLLFESQSEASREGKFCLVSTLIGNFSPSIQGGVLVTFSNKQLLKSTQSTDSRCGRVGFCFTLDSVGHSWVDT